VQSGRTARPGISGISTRMRFALGALLLAPVIALAAGGAPDPGFGGGGTVTGGFATGVAGLGLQSDGAIVVAVGESTPTSSDVVLRRWHADGTADPAFGTGGEVREPAATGAATALRVAPDDAILVAGVRCDGANGCVGTLRRYAPDGSVDAGFAGVELEPVTPAFAKALVRQPDGRIVLGGDGGRAPAFFVWLARFAGDGTPDTGFGTDGVALHLAASHAGTLDSLAAEPAGSVVAAFTGATSQASFSSLVRVAEAGDAVAAVPTELRNPHVALAPDGAVVVAGTLPVTAGQIATRVGVARFDAGLAPDPGFGGGTVAGPVGVAFDAVVQPDGRPVVAVCLGPPGATRFAVLRWTPDGTPDAGFGDAGAAVVLPGQVGQATHVVRQADGRLLAAGLAGDPQAPKRLVLARLLADGPPSSTTVPITPTTTSTLPAPLGCTTCDDGDPCTDDRCDAGQCVHETIRGFAGVQCLCALPAPPCGARRGRAVAALVDHVCGMLGRAHAARIDVARRLLRRADRRLAAAERRLARGAGRSCSGDPSGRVAELARTTRLLRKSFR
jgi:uncharacterized delta-60 repeat protein